MTFWMLMLEQQAIGCCFQGWCWKTDDAVTNRRKLETR